MTIVFPDTTVLINFALLDRMDILAALIGERGQWTGSVADECRDKSRSMDLPAMAPAAHRIFGEPLRPENPVEHLETRRIQDSFRKPGDGPRSHLGESETLALISQRSLQPSVFVTDDREVANRVRAEGLDVTCVTTWHLLKLAVSASIVTQQGALQRRELLAREGRAHFPHAQTASGFDAWLSRRE